MFKLDSDISTGQILQPHRPLKRGFRFGVPTLRASFDFRRCIWVSIRPHCKLSTSWYLSHSMQRVQGSPDVCLLFWPQNTGAHSCLKHWRQQEPCSIKYRRSTSSWVSACFHKHTFKLSSYFFFAKRKRKHQHNLEKIPENTNTYGWNYQKQPLKS